MQKHLFYIIIIFIFYTFKTQAQGCSDAGFCTMGAMKPDQNFKKKLDIKLRSLEISQYVGVTRFDDIIMAYTADLNIGIKDKNTLQVKLPYMLVYAPLANTNGLGDISLSYTRNIIQKEKYQFNLTVGAKIPTSDGNQFKVEGRTLPMYYQTSLGTYDIIFGASLITKKWLFALGYQQALNRIENKFIWGVWSETEQFEEVLRYPVGNGLYRGKDIMFRVERNFRFAKYSFNLGLLPIYRINEDVITSPRTGERTNTVNSNGLALTLLTGGAYNFSTKHALKVQFGFRLIQRDNNPDGLSREFVNTIGYLWRF